MTDQPNGRPPSRGFVLDPRLAADTLPVGPLSLCDVRLMNDRRFPWLVLVPRLEGAVEAFDLTAEQRTHLWEETCAVATHLKAWSGVPKVNIGMLGNIVSQLHIHIVGRTPDDAAWPGPVWGAGTADPYPTGVLADTLADLKARFPIAGTQFS